MSGKRKLWETLSQAHSRDLAVTSRHESKAAVYRWIQAQAGRLQDGALKDPHVIVYVDERDGHGFQCYERIDLREIVASWQLQ